MRVGSLATASGAVLVALLFCGCEAEASAPEGEDGEAGGEQGSSPPQRREPEPEQTAHNVIQDDVLIIRDDGSQIHGLCDGREVVVTADEAEVILEGSCELVRATGRGSSVEVGSADKIVLVGVDNTVSYTSGEPEVINRGRDTTVTRIGSATP